MTTSTRSTTCTGTTASSSTSTSAGEYNNTIHHIYQGPPRAGDSTLSLSLQDVFRCSSNLDETAAARLHDNATFTAARPLLQASPPPVPDEPRSRQAPHDPYLRRLYVASIIGEALQIMEEEDEDLMVLGNDGNYHHHGIEQVYPTLNNLYHPSQ